MNLLVFLLIMVRTCSTRNSIGSGVSKVSYILGYSGKNPRLKVSYMGFLKRAGTYCTTLFCNSRYNVAYFRLLNLWGSEIIMALLLARGEED